MLLTLSLGLGAKAVVLFPYFVDLVPNYKTIQQGEDAVITGHSAWGGIKDNETFLKDVLPSGEVTKVVMGTEACPVVVYLSDMVDANRVSAIYLVKRADDYLLYYTESGKDSQPLYQQKIIDGAL